MDPLELAATALATAHRRVHGVSAPSGLIAMLLALLEALGLTCPLAESQAWLDAGPIIAAIGIRRAAIYVRRQTGETIDIREATATFLEARKSATAAELDAARQAIAANG